MKLPKELINGIIIFIGIGLFFLLIESVGLKENYLLRFFNVLFIFYGTQRTLQSNFAEGKRLLSSNAVSALFTSLSGVFMSVVGLIVYSYVRGGDSYVESLSKTFLYGGTPSVMIYSVSLLLEGTVSAVLITFMLMLYWDTRYKSDKHGSKR